MPLMQCRVSKSMPRPAPLVGPRSLVADVLRSPGQPLDTATRARMEPLFGTDFSHVRVHADSLAALSAESVGASAFTVGSHVVFNHEQSLTTSAGRALLAHELAHVVQQQGLDSDPATALRVGSPHDSEERAAETAANRVVAGRTADPGLASPSAGSGNVIRRQPSPSGWSSDEISVNLTPPNVPQDPDVRASREPVWCQFGGRDRGSECKPLQACQTETKSVFQFLAIFRVDAPPPAPGYPAAARDQPIEVGGDFQFMPTGGTERNVGSFTASGTYRGPGSPVFRQRVVFDTSSDGDLSLVLKVSTPHEVRVFNGGVECVRIPCS